MRNYKAHTLMQAIIWRDHVRIAELAASGQHPLTCIERCIELRGEELETLMAYVPRECQTCVATIERIIAHLGMIAGYPSALQVLDNWLTTKRESPHSFT
jgi:hypothetical protein